MYLHLEYEWPDIASGIRTGNKLKTTPPMVRVTDVVDFLDYLKVNCPLLEAGAALQGLAGLQLQEATRLAWDRVDLKHGLVEIVAK